MKHYCVISHTHWDREWYLPLENFRLRLIDLIDHLLDILEEDGEFRFHLDAQTIVLEDYLAVRPGRKETLQKYIAGGRILVGPWYVQNDFHLTSGEATVRNLLIGMRQAEAFGGCMKVGYAADQFGMIAQLPQILSRFGMDTCVFGRGFDRGITEFYWETEDGSRVLCEHMKFWYNNLQRLPENAEMALNLIRDRAGKLEKICAGSEYLLMNGVDHLEAQENLTPILKSIQPLLKEDEHLLQDTLPEFMNRLKAEMEEKKLTLQTFRGEFRDNGADNVLTGTLAARVYLKQANARCQTLLESRLEPLYVMLENLGIASSPADHLRYLWKILIENHPHDSICGCSVDAVHEHMMDRFARVMEMGGELVERGYALLQEHLDRSGLSDRQFLLTVFNLSQISWKQPVEAAIKIPVSMDVGGLSIRTKDGEEIPYTLLSLRENITHRTLSPINLPGGIEVNEYKVMLHPGEVAPLSYRTLIVTPERRIPPVMQEKTEDSSVLENEHLLARIQENGTVNLTEKHSGRTYQGLLFLEDHVDIGDSYNYIENDEIPSLTTQHEKARITSVQNDALAQTRRVELTLHIDRKESRGIIPVTMEISLPKGSRMLLVNLKVENTCGYHRLRMHVPTGILTEKNYAGQPFDCYERNQESAYPNDRTHPFLGYAGLEDEQGGMAVMAEGLHEYEHRKDGTLAVTLLRCVDRICGGWAEDTPPDESWKAPGAQCLGLQSYRLALYPYGENRNEAEVFAQSQQFLCGAQAAFQPVDRTLFQGGRPFVQGPGTQGTFFRPLAHPEIRLPYEAGLLRISGSFQLTALKAAEDGDGWIVRGFNPTSMKARAEIVWEKPIQEAFRCRLSEEREEALCVEERKRIALNMLPKEIVTLRVKSVNCE